VSRLTQGHRAAAGAIEIEIEAMTADETTDAARTDEETTAGLADTRMIPTHPVAITGSASARIDMEVETAGEKIEVDGQSVGRLARTAVDRGHQEEADVIGTVVVMIDDETVAMSLRVVEVVAGTVTTEEAAEPTGRRAHLHLPRSANLHQTSPMWSQSWTESAA
jgi:hypothetical protein